MAVPRILQEAGDRDRIAIPVGTSTNLEKGDLLSYESNAAVLFDAATEDATFTGYMINQVSSDFSEPDRAVAGLKGIVEYDCDSANYAVGDGLKYSAENKVVDDGGSDTIVWSAEYATSVTRVDVIVDVLALGKLFASAN
tara:strand:+ start:4935 stop:5354 length:420 start_codon:yes stop_codon:yes gene_type:complete